MSMHKNIVSSLAIASLFVSGLSGESRAQIVSGGQVSQVDVSVGPVFPVPKTDDEQRDRMSTYSASHELLPGTPFAIFVGEAETGMPLQILHVGEVPEAGAPFIMELDTIQDAGLALFFQSQGLTARVNGRTGDGRGMGKRQPSDLVRLGVRSAGEDKLILSLSSLERHMRARGEAAVSGAAGSPKGSVFGGKM